MNSDDLALGANLVKMVNDSMTIIVEKLTKRIEKLETCLNNYQIGLVPSDYIRRLEKLGDVRSLTSNEYLGFLDRFEKLETVLAGQHPGTYINLKDRLEKLEHPEMEHIKENRKNIVDIAPQLLELANHHIDMLRRIEKLENWCKE